MSSRRVKYETVSSTPKRYQEVGIDMEGREDIRISDLEGKFRHGSEDIFFNIRILEDYAIVSKTRDEGSLIVIEMPELPKERRKRLVDEYGVSEETAEKVTSTRERADFYEGLAEKETGRVVGSVLTDVIFGELNYRDMTVTDIDVEDFEYLVELIVSDKITDKQSTDIIRKSLDEGLGTKEVFEKYDYEVVSEDELDIVVDEVVDREEKAVDDYMSGDDHAVNYLVGQVMSEMDGGAEAKEVRRKLIDRIED